MKRTLKWMCAVAMVSDAPQVEANLVSSLAFSTAITGVGFLISNKISERMDKGTTEVQEKKQRNMNKEEQRSLRYDDDRYRVIEERRIAKEKLDGEKYDERAYKERLEQEDKAWDQTMKAIEYRGNEQDQVDEANYNRKKQILMAAIERQRKFNNKKRKEWAKEKAKRVKKAAEARRKKRELKEQKELMQNLISKAVKKNNKAISQAFAKSEADAEPPEIEVVQTMMPGNGVPAASDNSGNNPDENDNQLTKEYDEAEAPPPLAPAPPTKPSASKQPTKPKAAKPRARANEDQYGADEMN